MLVVKHRNVYLDTSLLYAGSPRDGLHHVLLVRLGRHVVETALAGRLLFGSNYPRVDIRRSARAVRELDVSDAVKTGIAAGSARLLLESASKAGLPPSDEAIEQEGQ